MKRFLIFLSISMLIVSCNTNTPEQKKIIGAWYEHSEKDVIKSLVFEEDGTLLFAYEDTYTDKQETMQYTIEESILRISCLPNSQEEEPCIYSTSFSISQNKLTIDSIVCLKQTFRDLKLSSGTKYQSVSLNNEDTDRFNHIFDRSNELLKNYAPFQLVVVSTKEQLRSICPPSIALPEIDFTQQCLIFAPIELSSISDQLISSSLYRDPINKCFEYIVDIQKCTNCYTAMDCKYAFGIYPITYENIQNVRKTVKLVNKY